MKLSILYIGRNTGTSRHRALALQRLGHNVLVVDPRQCLPSGRWMNYWNHHTGAVFSGSLVRRRLLRQVAGKRFDLTFVNCGEFVDRSLVLSLKRQCDRVINYNNDDPFSTRDGRKWRLYLEALDSYNLVAVVRDCNVPEARAAGAKRVIRVYMSADEVAHRPRELTREDYSHWRSEVAFIGTWMPERGPFLARLAALGIPLAIYGHAWNRAKEWPVLRSFWKGAELRDSDDYAKAIQCARVCLGLLSLGNRDLSTTRSFEIPSLGGVLCAQRTADHRALYREDKEAAFWETPEECAARCRQLLSSDEHRSEVAAAGRTRFLLNRTSNEAILSRILDESIAA